MSSPLNGGSPGMTPIWHPPVESRWIFALLLVFAGALANRIPPTILQIFTNPIGFFITALVAIASHRLGFVPGAFAVLFFLLMVWSAHKSKQTEGFLNASNTIDWVNNSQRWFVEKTLKEHPKGIQEKGVDTFPIQGATTQSSSATGNT